MGPYYFRVGWHPDFHSILMVLQAKALDAVVVIVLFYKSLVVKVSKWKESVPY